MFIDIKKRIGEQARALQSRRATVERVIIHIAILDDDPLRLVGFQSILDQIPEFNVIGISVDEVVGNHNVHLAVLGNHSGMKFVETMSMLQSVRPDLRVVVTGTGVDEETILKVIASGAKGYVDEAALPCDLVQAIYAVHNGSAWIPRRVMSMFIERLCGSVRCKSFGLTTLTPRQKQVLQILVAGRSNKEIGVPLGIKERTVKSHVAKLMRMTGVKNRIALSTHAITHFLVSVGGDTVELCSAMRADNKLECGRT
jgi:DNA-binding NarL/FixJ family response regulator